MVNLPHTSDRSTSRRLMVYSIGLWWQGRPKRILQLAGWQLARFRRSGAAGVAVWGRKRGAERGIRVAQAHDLPLVTVEDAFLRSVRTGREGAPGLGIVADHTGISFDTGAPSDLLDLIRSSEAMTATERADAEVALAKLRHRRLSKYNAFDPDLSGLPEKFVLVLDQASKDASIKLGGGSPEVFARMLAAARAENPGATFLIKAHPETIAGTRSGHFAAGYADPDIIVWTRRTNPFALLERASSVYCVTSQMGFEAMLAGHRPKVFGRPFFAGWGQSDDRNPDQVARGQRNVLQIFWAAYLRYPIWYDPFSDQLCQIGRVMDILQAEAKHWTATQNGMVCVGFSRWKRPFVRRYLSAPDRGVQFARSAEAGLKRAQTQGCDLAIWGAEETPALRQVCEADNIRLWRVEDGFVRSLGLGAAKVRPASLLLDDLGVHYDPARPSRLEHLITQSVDLPEFELERARVLRDRITRQRLSKYNLRRRPVRVPDTKGREVVLAVGQVEDDASIRLGAGRIARNGDLIQAACSRFRDAFLIFKPHPDVEAGYRRSTPLGNAVRLIDYVAEEADIIDLIGQVDRVCTMTSLTGFEALLHGKPVTTFGAPFYAGWGLTEDLGKVPLRRRARPSLDQLVHASLIDYPCYWEPASGAPCPVEVVLERFEAAQASRRRGVVRNRALFAWPGK